MLKSRLIICPILSLVLVACGGSTESEPGTDGERAKSTPARPAAGAESEVLSDPASMACADGGTACRAGLECLAWRDGNRACAPPAAPGVVLIQDATLGGSCLSPDPADTYPGASIASLRIIGVDGNTNGYGRMVWDHAGFEVATERGSPPDGTEFTGDACTDAYNIGCDGQAVFEIVDDDGDVRRLREGEMVIVHLRGQDACGEEVVDDVAAVICNEPGAAASGNLESCTFNVRMVEARRDLYGPDRRGGTIIFFKAR